jgi:hypothetical protein
VSHVTRFFFSSALLGFLGFYDVVFSTAGVAEFMQCALVVSLSCNRGLIIADVEHNVTTP